MPIVKHAIRASASCPSGRIWGLFGATSGDEAVGGCVRVIAQPSFIIIAELYGVLGCVLGHLGGRRQTQGLHTGQVRNDESK